MIDDKLSQEYEVLANKLKQLVKQSQFISTIIPINQEFEQLVIDEFSGACTSIKRQLTKIKNMQVDIIKGG